VMLGNRRFSVSSTETEEQLGLFDPRFEACDEVALFQVDPEPVPTPPPPASPPAASQPPPRTRRPRGQSPALPVKRLARGDDAETSLLAAIKASKASRKAVEAVGRAMEDGAGRIDEEIWLTCRAMGYVSSYDTVRHGRLALSEAGILVETGETRLTRDNTPSRVWRLATPASPAVES